MKFTMNGALTIGTLDGADNFFLFGQTVEEIRQLRDQYRPWEWLERLPDLQEAFALIERGHFSGG